MDELPPGPDGSWLRSHARAAGAAALVVILLVVGAVVVGAVVGVGSRSGPDGGTVDVLAAPSSPEVVLTSPVSSSPTGEPAPSGAPSAGPARSAGPTAPTAPAAAEVEPSPSAAPTEPATRMPSASPLPSAPPLAAGPDLLRVSVEVLPRPAAAGDELEARVTVLNTSALTLALPDVSTCGEGFGDLEGQVQDKRFAFTTNGDTCFHLTGRTLQPGERTTTSGWRRLPAGLDAGQVVVTALAQFTALTADDSPTYSSTGRGSGPVLSDDEGTRTFLLRNDTDQEVSVQCSCTEPLTWWIGLRIAPGEQVRLQASLTRRQDVFVSSADAPASSACVDVSGVPAGSRDTMLLVSSRQVCRTT